jgi:ssDNA-binding Zn-finger/Zn-ribbon topoisomerase 1
VGSREAHGSAFPVPNQTTRETEMTDFHFAYEGQCKITAETYDEAVKEFTQMLRGIYTYLPIHPTCSMLATPDEFDDYYEEEEIEEEQENEEIDNPCPECGKQLRMKWSGVDCSCGYWFCL